MPDEKLNTGPEQAEVPAGAPGDVVVSADQIEKLMAEHRAAERAGAEKSEPSKPEQPPAQVPELTEGNSRHRPITPVLTGGWGG